ncbi:MAG: DUF2807 domain-containing protein [Bacteroidota bacterium]|nr:DUF2807 domain-containing protein [Bacteroidota bacterium]
MKQLFFALSLLVSLGLYAQKTIKDPNAVKRNAHNFHAIDISDGIDLYLSQGNEEAVAVSASDKDYRDKITVEVVDGVLKIYFEKGNRWGFHFGNRKLKAYVSAKTLDGLTASGGSDVFIDQTLKSENLVVHVSGGSDFRGRVESNTLKLHASGGSDMYISGNTENLSIEASGGSDIHGFDMVSNFCRISTSGGSDVRISANREIDASSSGGSDVYYKGTASIRSSKSGGGSIKKVQ